MLATRAAGKQERLCVHAAPATMMVVNHSRILRERLAGPRSLSIMAGDEHLSAFAIDIQSLYAVLKPPQWRPLTRTGTSISRIITILPLPCRA
jgi:hypothetical protein